MKEELTKSERKEDLESSVDCEVEYKKTIRLASVSAAKVEGEVEETEEISEREEEEEEEEEEEDDDDDDDDDILLPFTRLVAKGVIAVKETSVLSEVELSLSSSSSSSSSSVSSSKS